MVNDKVLGDLVGKKLFRESETSLNSKKQKALHQAKKARYKMRCLGKDLRIIIFYECIKRKRKIKQNDDSQSVEREAYIKAR